MNDLRRHATKAAIGIGASLLYLIVPLVCMFLDRDRKFIWLWILLIFCTMPAVGWGAANLAMARGYSSAGGCGVCIIGYSISGVLGTTSAHPLVFGIGVMFIILLPIVVLFALPSKNRRHHRRRHRHQHVANIER